jgi:CRP-like cAMP-binding protein
MKRKATQAFDPKVFPAKVGKGRTRADYSKNQRVFSQGDEADAIFYIQKGKVKLTVISRQGKEAVIALLGANDFFGEGCLAGQARRMASATSMSECSIMRLKKEDVIPVLHAQPAFTELFLHYVLSRNIRIEEDLVDQLFNSSEKRLARVLLPAGQLRQGRQTGTGDSENEPGNTGGDCRHHSLQGQLFHEQVPGPGLHRIQRWPAC